MLWLVGGLLAWPVAGVLADGRDGHDHDRARRAVQAGAVLPLQTLLQQVARTHPGQVLEVELEDEHGHWVYEIKLLQPDGRLVKLEVDARSAVVLKARTRGAPGVDSRDEPRRGPGEADIHKRNDQREQQGR